MHEGQPQLAAARGAHVAQLALAAGELLHHHAGIGFVDIDQHLLHRLLAGAGVGVVAGQHAGPADGQFEALAAHLLDQHAELQFAAAGDLERLGLVAVGDLDGDVALGLAEQPLADLAAR